MRNPRSLAAAGVSIGLTAVAMVVFQPSAPLAGAAGVPLSRQTGLAGRTAAQVGSRLLIDSLSEPAPSAGSRSVPGDGSAGDATIALKWLHLSAPVGHPPVRPSVPAPKATVPVTTAPPAPAVPTAPAAPAPSAPAPPVAPAAPSGPSAPAGPLAPTPGIWAELRECESGDNYTIDTGNGYYGAYQFAAATWQGLGYPGLPNQAPPAVQDQAAAELQAQRGWAPWPECSVKLGL